eukprot:TRINITY_DN247_c0_g1_i4.p1 TRINITY_DN247_c0_g1~~TRINITY_DN247_c0_g1_i4.p1  ORF type:complete len:362 (-),score=63.11 TRINITY_DN247_c0_g1_i4:132-1217(-)
MALRTVLGENRILGDLNRVNVKRNSEPQKATVGKSVSSVKSKQKVLLQKRLEQKCEKRVQDLPVVPEGIVNIDATDEVKGNPQTCSEYTPYLYSYLREVEAKCSIRKDFLHGFHINGRIRSILVDWLIEVHSQFKLLQETFFLAIYMLDRYMQLDGINVKRNRYQLVGTTALFTASKIEEMYPPEIRDFVYITDNSFTAHDIRQTELRMLSVLKFAVNRPLPLHFLRRYSKAAEVDIVQHTLAKYLVELSQVEYELAHVSPSEISAASLFLSLLLLSPDTRVDVWSRTLEYYSQYKAGCLIPTVTRLAALANTAHKSKLQAVYKKYCSRSKLSVAILPELKGIGMKKILNNDLERQLQNLS